MLQGLPLSDRLRSTPPSREATRIQRAQLDLSEVAIHAPLAGGDPGPR